MKIPLARPDITEWEIEAVVNVMRSPYLSLGPKLEEFEVKLAEYVNVQYAVAVNSGTSALHLIIKALGIEEGDEVITTPFSFVARGPRLFLWTLIPLRGILTLISLAQRSPIKQKPYWLSMSLDILPNGIGFGR